MSRLGRTLAWGTAGTLALNVTTVAMNFVVAVLLSHLLGAEGYGAYAFAIAWVAVLSVPATLGLSPLVIRVVSASVARERWGLLRGVLRWSNAVVAVASVVVTSLAAAVGWAIERGKPELLEPYLLGLLLVPLLAFTTMRQSAMQGLGRVVSGRAPEALVTPFLFVALVVLARVVLGDRLTATWAVGLNVAAGLAALACGMVLLRRSLPAGVGAQRPEYETRGWLASALPLLLLSGATALQPQIGTIMTGALGDTGEAGVYNVAQRVALLAVFFHSAAAYPLMPMTSRLYAEGDVRRIEAVLARAARVVALASLPLVLGLLVLSRPVLGLFGSGFGDGATALDILLVGMFVRLLTGFPGLALVMTRHERALTLTALAGTVLTVALSLALVPRWGAEGAAFALVAGMGAADLALVVLASRLLHVYVGAVPLPRRR